MPELSYTRHTTGQQSPKMRRKDAQRRHKAKLRRRRANRNLSPKLGMTPPRKPLNRS
jgi:hypothetical protein